MAYKDEIEKYNNAFSDEKTIEEYLLQKANNHKNYQQYVSIEHLLSVVENKKMYLFDGHDWNDKNDRRFMSKGLRFGKCFSFGSAENIFLWMLYNNDFGKDGAMMKIPQKLMKEILKSEIQIGDFGEESSFETLDRKDYYIRLIDVLYENKTSNGYFTYSHYEKYHSHHRRLKRQSIVIKNIAWTHERETRLLIDVNKRFEGNIQDYRKACVRICLLDTIAKELKKYAFYSPVFDSSKPKPRYLKPSSLYDSVDWKK